MLFSLICSQWVDCALLFFSNSRQLTQVFSPRGVRCICCTQISENNEITITSSQLYFNTRRLCQQTKTHRMGRYFQQHAYPFLSSFPSASLTLTHNVFVPVFCIHLMPFPLSHSGSLLLSQLDIPDVSLIRHTNVIHLLYNHPFSCFHALSPNLRHVLWILFHSSTPDYISFHLIYSVFVQKPHAGLL